MKPLRTVAGRCVLVDVASRGFRRIRSTCKIYCSFLDTEYMGLINDIKYEQMKLTQGRPESDCIRIDSIIVGIGNGVTASQRPSLPGVYAYRMMQLKIVFFIQSTA